MFTSCALNKSSKCKHNTSDRKGFHALAHHRCLSRSHLWLRPPETRSEWDHLCRWTSEAQSHQLWWHSAPKLWELQEIVFIQQLMSAQTFLNPILLQLILLKSCLVGIKKPADSYVTKCSESDEALLLLLRPQTLRTWCFSTFWSVSALTEIESLISNLLK